MPSLDFESSVQQSTQELQSENTFMSGTEFCIDFSSFAFPTVSNDYNDSFKNISFDCSVPNTSLND